MTNDITEFMTWFLDEIINLFTQIFNILDSITFMGTSLLRVLLFILILGSLIGVILTIGKSVSTNLSKSQRSERVKERSNK